MEKNLIISLHFFDFFEMETPHIPDKYGEFFSSYHTIPNDDRELQRRLYNPRTCPDHTIPNDDRELQRPQREQHAKSIIPYQMMTGNYSYLDYFTIMEFIIPYQMMTGNYSKLPAS